MDRAARAVEVVLNDAGDAVADVAETAGSLMCDGLARLGPATGWMGRVAAGVLNVVAAAITGATGVVGGVPAGLVRVVGGIAVWDQRLAVRGIVGIGSSVVGAVVLLAGTAVAALQRVVMAEAPPRPLTPGELTSLRGVFRGSVALHNVRVVQGRAGAFAVNPRPFTLGNTIYLKGIDLAARPDVLVHEVVHVWQYQHEGPRYTTDALGAQVVYGWRGRGAYDWEAELARGRTSWTELNKEAQGSSIQEIWRADRGAFFERPDEATFRVDHNGTTVDHTRFAAEATDALRGRPSRRLSSRIRSG